MHEPGASPLRADARRHRRGAENCRAAPECGNSGLARFSLIKECKEPAQSGLTHNLEMDG